MEKIQVYLPKEELDALRKLGMRSGRSMSGIVRQAIRNMMPLAQASGLVALWEGEPALSSVEHDNP